GPAVPAVLAPARAPDRSGPEPRLAGVPLASPANHVERRKRVLVGGRVVVDGRRAPRAQSAARRLLIVAALLRQDEGVAVASRRGVDGRLEIGRAACRGGGWMVGG